MIHFSQRYLHYESPDWLVSFNRNKDMKKNTGHVFQNQEIYLFIHKGRHYSPSCAYHPYHNPFTHTTFKNSFFKSPDDTNS